MRIAINAQITPNSGAGGVEAIIIGLIKALGRLTDGDEEYIIIGPSKDNLWIEQYIGSNQSIIEGPKKNIKEKIRNRISNEIRSMYSIPEIPLSNGFYESLNCDVIHFPFQQFVLCSIPSIYNPHDLQHLHYPEYFSPKAIINKETVYQAGCHYSKKVVVASNWIKQDIMRQYCTHPEKIQVIPWAPPTSVYSNPNSQIIEMVKDKYQIESPFAFYPAMTWKHKNHIRLIESLALLRDSEKVRINLICTGYQNVFWPAIKQKIRDLNLENQVKFLGLVSGEEIRALYFLSQFVIVPTLFEAASGPVFEAWLEKKAVACSSVTSLPEQTSGAALLFNPLSTVDIADALLKMSTDENLRKCLIERGQKRLEYFSWEKTARAYRAIYRQTAGFEITEKDVELLNNYIM